jgi:hypothetical protein
VRDGEEAAMRVEQRLEELGLVLPGPPQVPPGFKFSFSWVRVWDGKAYVSGHSVWTIREFTGWSIRESDTPTLVKF